MMNSDSGYHITVTVDQNDATAYMVIHGKELTVPVFLKDEERRELVALLVHPNDEDKRIKQMTEFIDDLQRRLDFKILQFKGKKKE
jgi:hypothetical protein